MYEREFSVDSGEALEVNEDVAQTFAKAFMTIQIFEINKETEKEKLSETIKLDLSCFLFPKENINVSLFHTLMDYSSIGTSTSLRRFKSIGLR
jgi:hypothetical protein